MTLLEAFRVIGPNEGDSDDVQRNDAAAVVQGELQRLSRRLTFGEEIAEEAVLRVTLNMISGSATTSGALACDSDARVRGFLRRSLRNMAIDLWRRHHAEAQEPTEFTDRDLDLVAGGDSPEDAIAESPQDAALRIERAFHEEVVPACALTIRESARADFLASVAHMRALAFEETTFEDVVRVATGREGKAAEDSVYQRHSRARERLLQFIDAEEDAARLDTEQAERYRRCVSFLQRRASSAREVARRGLRDLP